MADAGEHGGALVRERGEAFLHVDQRARGVAYFGRAGGAEVRQVAAPAEGARGFGEAQDGADLLVEKADGERDHQQREGDDPDDEDVRVDHERALAVDDDLAPALRRREADMQARVAALQPDEDRRAGAAHQLGPQHAAIGKGLLQVRVGNRIVRQLAGKPGLQLELDLGEIVGRIGRVQARGTDEVGIAGNRLRELAVHFGHLA